MINFNEIKQFEPSEIKMEGEKITLDNMVNKEMAFTDIKIFPSSFYEGDYASIQVMNMLNEKFWFRTGSKVLIAQLMELKDKGKLPVRATIRKVKRYYTLA